MSLETFGMSKTEDGDLLQKVVKRGLFALAFAIMLLSCVAILTVIQLTDFYQNKVHVITEQVNLLHTMRVAARDRILSLYKMLDENDPFINDDNRMEFYSVGAKFAEARIKFINSPLSENEIHLVKYKDVLIRPDRLEQELVLDLIIREEDGLAKKVLQKEAIPEQNKILKALEQLEVSLNNRSSEISKKANSFGQLSIIILVATVAIIITGVIYIFQQTTRSTYNLISQLNSTRQTLKKTIRELSQKKKTVDHHAIVSIADRQGNITYVNDKFCEISGYSREELMGKNHRILKSNVHSADFYKNLWGTISSGNVWQGKICNLAKDGEHYWVESTINPFLDEKGKPYQYVSVRTDITHLLEEKIKAEEANRAKSVFLSSMSHEIRTPMNAILGFSQLINMAAEDELIKDNSQEIITAGDHLLGLINEILDLSQIESGKMNLEIGSYNLKTIIEPCVSLIKPSANDAFIQLDDNIDSIPDINVNVDYKRFKQVILNLLSNAVKYNREKGSVTIDYLVEDNGTLCISVTDTGKGIEQSQQKNIFNPFNRAGEENSNITGSGLGLVITRNLLELMKGSIDFESTVGKGSTFWVKVPISS